MQKACCQAELIIKKYQRKSAHLTNVSFKIRNRAKNRGESIVSYAHREGCDCIILGRRFLFKFGSVKNVTNYFRSNWENNDCGQLSNYIVNHAWIPVLVCPSDYETAL